MIAPTESEKPWPGYRTYPNRLNLAQAVLEPAIERGLDDRIALIGDGLTLSYATLNRQVNALAGGLIQLGLKRGDLVLIKMSNCAEFALAFLAAVKLGAVPVLVNSLLSASELKSIVQQAQPRLVFTEAARADAVRELRNAGLIQGCRLRWKGGGGRNLFRSAVGHKRHRRFYCRYRRR